MVSYKICFDFFFHTLKKKELLEELSPQKTAMVLIIVNIMIQRVIAKKSVDPILFLKYLIVLKIIVLKRNT